MTKMWLVPLLIGALSAMSCTTTIDAVTKQPINPNPGTTSLGADLDDLQMDTIIAVNIKKAHPQLDTAHINVTTYNKVVLLTGEVPEDALRTLAGDTARKFRGVRQVHNELQVRGTSSLLARTNDSWLTTKVKTKLLARNDIEGTRMKVVTEAGVVYLMGIVTRLEAETAASIASNTRGALRVVKVFEYLD